MKPTYGEMRTRAECIADEEVKENILAGLTVLQQEHGDAWVEKIDCKTLNISHYAQCVLGQVYGEFEHGVVELNGVFDFAWAAEHGFETYTSYSVLEQAWRKVLCDGD